MSVFISMFMQFTLFIISKSFWYYKDSENRHKIMPFRGNVLIKCLKYIMENLASQVYFN